MRHTPLTNLFKTIQNQLLKFLSNESIQFSQFEANEITEDSL